jgi:hypothetical protein
MLPVPASIAAPPSPSSRVSWNPAVPPPPVCGGPVTVTVTVTVGVGLAPALGVGDRDAELDTVAEGLALALALPLAEVAAPLSAAEPVSEGGG